MLNRFKLGILFYFNPQWMGGIIYVINVIKTLTYLKDEEKPEILLFYNAELRTYTTELNYPYLNLIEWAFPAMLKGNISSLIKQENEFISNVIEKYPLDAIFPLHDFPVRTKTSIKLVSWWADLQHKHYPEFFTRGQRMARDIRIKNILRNCDHIVVSSQDVLNDFMKFYRLRDGLKFHLFRFRSVVDKFEDIEIDELRGKYNLSKQYFLVSNQFHKHKNHRVLLKSLALLKEQGKEICIAMTGKFPDAAHSQYMQELHTLIDANNLRPNIRLLGIIPRDEQLLLMKHSRAVIQPSLFEGWSTVIEDAISLQVPVLASSLPVNIEQLGSTGTYFDPHDYKKLAELIAHQPDREEGRLLYQEYKERIRDAARTFMNIITN